jgi:hypothetical protein
MLRWESLGESNRRENWVVEPSCDNAWDLVELGQAESILRLNIGAREWMTFLYLIVKDSQRKAIVFKGKPLERFDRL